MTGLSEKITLFKQAIAEHKTVRFDYYYAKGEMSREIEPYFVEFRWNAWYVFGWCRLREDFRRFKLNRLWKYELTGEIFIPHAVPPGKSNAEDAFPEQYHIKILFDKSVRFRLIEAYGLHCYEEIESGLLFTLDYTNKDYIFSWILGFGDKATVLEPEGVRAEFYRDVIGMPVLGEVDSHYDGVSLGFVAEPHLCIWRADQNKKANSGSAELVFMCDDVDKTYEGLCHRGLVCNPPFETYWGGLVLELSDPDGNLVRLRT